MLLTNHLCTFLLVPGVVNFISGSCPITEMEDNSLQELQFQSSQSSTNNHLEQSNQQIGNNSCGDFASIEAVSVKKYSRKFGFTGYGLASSAPEKKKHKSGGSTDNSDSEERGSLDDRNCESTENSSRASPVDGFLDNSMASQPSTSKGISNIIPKVERKPVKLPAKATVPDYQQGLDDEEVAMLYGFSSLTTSALLDKVKDIQNVAYQLGLEEEREMARARFLNILGDCQASESLISGVFLNTNGEFSHFITKCFAKILMFSFFGIDLAFAEAKTLDDPKTDPSTTTNSIANGISAPASSSSSSSNGTSTLASTNTTITTVTAKKKSSK